MRFSLPRFLPLAVALLIGCGDGASAPDNTPATISLSPSSPITLQSGATATITATVSNRGGKPVSGSVVTWSSSDAAVASVAGGIVTAAKVGSATITAGVGTVSASLVVTTTPGAATQLAMRTQPLGAAIGSPFATQPAVEIRDAAGNVVASSTATVSASIESGGGTLVGTSSVTAVGGVATFTGLSIIGTAGPRALTFSAPGLATVTSARFTITPPPTPYIILDTNVVTRTVPRGTTPAPVTIGITNGGFADLTGMTLDSVQFDAGQPTGWLTAQLSTPTAPATLTLAFSTADLVEGNYHATVRLNGPGAPNSPASLSITVAVIPNYTVTYGGPNEKVRILEIGNSYAPAVAVTDPRGPVPGVPLTFRSRAASVATVDPDGRITARGEGDTWVVVSSDVSSDSVFVVVPRSGGGPVLRSNVSTWLTRVADTLFGTVSLDTRSTPVGAASLAVSLQFISGSAAFIFAAAPGPPSPTVNLSGPGVIRISVGAAAGMSGNIALLNFKLVSRFAGTAGWLSFTALDVSGVDASSLTAATTSTRLPFVMR